MRKLIAINEIMLVFVNLLFFKEINRNSFIIYGGMFLISLIHICNLNSFYRLFSINYWIPKTIIYIFLGIIFFSIFQHQNLNISIFLEVIFLSVLVKIISKTQILKLIFENDIIEKKSWLEESKYWKLFSDRFCWNYRDLRKRSLRSSSVVLTIIWTFAASYLLIGTQSYWLLSVLLIFVLNVLFFLQISASVDWSNSNSLENKSTKDIIDFVSLQNQWMILRGTIIGMLIVFCLEKNHRVYNFVLMNLMLAIFIYFFSYLFLRVSVKKSKEMIK